MPTFRKNRVKLHDIAQASGVSLTAVSLALSDKPGISQATRGRVIEVARSLGYRFKPPLRNRSIKAMKTLGLLVNKGEEQNALSLHSHIVAAIEQASQQMGVGFTIASLPLVGDHPMREVPAFFENGDVDGVFLVGISGNSALEQMLDSHPYRVVLVDAYIQGAMYNAVSIDNMVGAYRATEYLIRKGHRQIAFIGGDDHAFPGFRERREGYCRAMADNNLDKLYMVDCSSDHDEIDAAVVNLLRKHSQVTALVGVNDDTAIAAMKALQDNGLRIPHDMSIIGFDDIPLAECVNPALTTVHVNQQGIGRLAVQMLTHLMSQPDSGVVTSVFRPALIGRDSVQPLSSGGNIKTSQ